jgi:hypothetical protein
MAQGRREHPRTTRTAKGRPERPKDDPNTPRTTRTAQGQPEHLKDHPNSPGTTRTPQGRREHPKDDANGPTTTPIPHTRREQRRDNANTPGTTRTAQRWRGGPDAEMGSPSRLRRQRLGPHKNREGIRSRALLCSFFMCSLLLGSCT